MMFMNLNSNKSNISSSNVVITISIRILSLQLTTVLCGPDEPEKTKRGPNK